MVGCGEETAGVTGMGEEGISPVLPDASFSPMLTSPILHVLNGCVQHDGLSRGNSGDVLDNWLLAKMWLPAISSN